ncbi:MAG: hypothetical protein Q9N26_08865, partial [Aquificota bacterium]|nr:hypothetical protein [Aquificota bacterium]
ELKSENINNGNYTLFVIKSKGNYFSALVANELINSNLVNWYILKRFSNKYFELIYDNFPILVLYRVK